MKAFLFLVCLFAFSHAQLDFVMEPVDESRFMDFIKGFMEGLNEQGDINKLVGCIRDADAIIQEIIQALELIKTREIMDIIEGISKLVKAVKKIIEMLQPCSEGFKQFKKLMEALKNFDIQKLVIKILSNIEKIIGLIKDCIAGFKNKDFYAAGKNLGSLLFILFLSDAEFAAEDSSNIYILAVENFIKAANQGHHLDNIQTCACVIRPVIEDFNVILKESDWSSIEAIVNSVNRILDLAERVVNALIPCSTIGQDFKKLGEIIKDLDMNKLTNRLLRNIGDVTSSLTLFSQYVASKEFDKAGTELGNVFYIMVLKEDKSKF